MRGINLAELGGFAQLSESGSPQAIEIPFARGRLCQQMFSDLQRRRRPLTNKASISKDVVQRAAQDRDRRGIVGLTSWTCHVLSGDNYDEVTT